MRAFRSYRDLDVWQVAVSLTELCYRETAAFPREEVYGLTSQIRRAAVSIPANIAEGYGRESTGNYVQFLKIAQGSLKELETLMIVSVRVDLLSEAASEKLLAECERIGKMLRGLIRALESQP